MSWDRFHIWDAVPGQASVASSTRTSATEWAWTVNALATDAESWQPIWVATWGAARKLALGAPRDGRANVIEAAIETAVEQALDLITLDLARGSHR